MRFPRHKYSAVRTELDGIKFPSKAQARYYASLKAMQASGEVVGFLREVPFYLPGGVRYVCDFQVFWADGRVAFIDVKGVETTVFKAKKRMVEALYPWIGEIELVQA
jgi:hypothetical protein